MMRFAILEIHDVSPYYRDEFLEIVSLLKGLGLNKFSLLIVPYFWEKYPLNDDLDFVKELKSLNAEPLLHGFTHLGKTSFIGNLWTKNEGEFYYLNESETCQRVYQGQVLLCRLGFNCDFFVPPAWIGNPFLDSILKKLGFKGVAYRFYIKFFDANLKVFSPVLTLSNRPYFSGLSKFLLGITEWCLRGAGVLRVGIHCADFRDKDKKELWKKTLNKIKAERRFMSYGELACQSGLTSSFQCLWFPDRLV